MIIVLSMAKRLRVEGNRARIENIETCKAGPWHEFSWNSEEIADTFIDWATGDAVIHYTDGSYQRARYDRDAQTLVFGIRVFPQWVIFDE